MKTYKLYAVKRGDRYLQQDAHGRCYTPSEVFAKLYMGPMVTSLGSRRDRVVTLNVVECEEGESPPDVEALQQSLSIACDTIELLQADKYALERENGELQRERDAYKRAKEENDDRFMREREEARHERDVALRELAEARPQSGCITVAGDYWRQVHFERDESAKLAAQHAAEVARLREMLACATEYTDPLVRWRVQRDPYGTRWSWWRYYEHESKTEIMAEGVCDTLEAAFAAAKKEGT